jgi:hypothetical protein
MQPRDPEAGIKHTALRFWWSTLIITELATASSCPTVTQSSCIYTVYTKVILMTCVLVNIRILSITELQRQVVQL